MTCHESGQISQWGGIEAPNTSFSQTTLFGTDQGQMNLWLLLVRKSLALSGILHVRIQLPRTSVQNHDAGTDNSGKDCDAPFWRALFFQGEVW